MTSHCRYNERLGTNPLEILNRSFHNCCKVGNTPATNTNGNIGARLNFLLQTRVFPLQQSFPCYIFNFRLLCNLLHKCQCWNMHENTSNNNFICFFYIKVQGMLRQKNTTYRFLWIPTHHIAFDC